MIFLFSWRGSYLGLHIWRVSASKSCWIWKNNDRESPLVIFKPVTVLHITCDRISEPSDCTSTYVHNCPSAMWYVGWYVLQCLKCINTKFISFMKARLTSKCIYNLFLPWLKLLYVDAFLSFRMMWLVGGLNYHIFEIYFDDLDTRDVWLFFTTCFICQTKFMPVEFWVSQLSRMFGVNLK